MTKDINLSFIFTLKRHEKSIRNEITRSALKTNVKTPKIYIYTCPFIARKYVRDRQHLHVSRFPCDSFGLQVK